MPLDRGCSREAAQNNYRQLYKEGKRNPQLSAIVLSILKKSCGVSPKSSMSQKEILAKGIKTEAIPKGRPARWSRAEHEAKLKREKREKEEKEEKKSKGIGGKLRKGFKMVFGREVKVSPVPVPHQKRMRKEWVDLNDLFEGLPSSPAVRGLSFNLPGGMRGVGTSPSSAPPNDSRGLAGGAAPPIPLVKCEGCGAVYNMGSNDKCPKCRRVS